MGEDLRISKLRLGSAQNPLKSVATQANILCLYGEYLKNPNASRSAPALNHGCNTIEV